MNMKSLILMPLLMGSMGLAIWSGVKIWSTGGEIAWVGAFLTTVPFPAFITGIMTVARRARTPSRLPASQMVTFLGLGLAIYGTMMADGAANTSGNVPLAVAVFGLVVLQWYVRIYSSYGRKKSAAITVGKPLPQIPLETLEGKSISSADFVGSKTLIVFFRANWCPLCMAQMKEIRERADILAAANVQVKFITNQSVAKSRELVVKFKFPDQIQVLTDRDLKAAKALSIEDMGGTPTGMVGYPKDTVMATVITLDEQGVVTFGDETDNYRVRPHPDTFMSALEA